MKSEIKNVLGLFRQRRSENFSFALMNLSRSSLAPRKAPAAQALLNPSLIEGLRAALTSRLMEAWVQSQIAETPAGDRSALATLGRLQPGQTGSYCQKDNQAPASRVKP